ncbi:MAG: GNAT family N-acetyltransferase [Alistipes sp.]
MNEELTFRPATTADTARIVEIIGQAKAQMRALGSRQWQEGYPAAADITADLARGCGWVLTEAVAAADDNPNAQRVIAYGAVVFDGEPAYRDLEGEWLNAGDYVVVHRIAVADGAKGRGVATEFIRRVAMLARRRGIAAFRIDTNFDNGYMLRLLDTQGFSFCGRVHYASGERLAYEKLL